MFFLVSGRCLVATGPWKELAVEDTVSLAQHTLVFHRKCHHLQREVDIGMTLLC